MTHFFRKGYVFFAALAMVLVLASCAERPLPPHKPFPTTPYTRTTPPMSHRTQPEAPIQYANPSSIVKVGLLLPLSGESATLGNAMQDAATLALFDKYASMSPADVRVKMVLVPKDSGTDPTTVTKATRELLDEGVMLIIGPVFSQLVQAVAPYAQQKNVNIITFSNNRQVAGQGTYLFGFMPEEQITRVVNYAFARGITRVGAFLPQNAYGTAVQRALADTMRAHDSRVTPLEYYPPLAQDLSVQTARLALVRQSDAYPDGYQGLLIAEGGQKLDAIAQSLAAGGVTPGTTKFLGTGLWDDATILRSPYLMGGWFASSAPDATQQFEEKFTRKYGYKPARLASLAYDAVALAATLAMDPKGTDFSSKAITSPTGFSGPANGIFRFRPDGVCERGLAVMEVTPGGFRVIDPAPEYFSF